LCQSLYLTSSWRTASSRPTRMTVTGWDLTARTAPNTSGTGAVSPPMASTAIVIMELKALPRRTGPGKLLLDDFDHFAPLVEAAAWARAMGQFLLMTLGALRDTGAGQAVVGAASRRATLRVAALGIRHRKSFLRNLPGDENPAQR